MGIASPPCLLLRELLLNFVSVCFWCYAGIVRGRERERERKREGEGGGGRVGGRRVGVSENDGGRDNFFLFYFNLTVNRRGYFSAERCMGGCGCASD